MGLGRSHFWLLFVISAVYGAVRVNGECKDSTIEVDTEYEVIPGKFTFDEALVKCAKVGGQLARITNIAEQHEVKEVLLKVNKDSRQSWIGFKTAPGSSSLIDAYTMKPIGPYRRFLPAANVIAPGSCLTVGTDEKFPSLWGAQKCEDTASALCEFVKAPEDYQIFIAYSANGINYEEAKALCRQRNGEIAIFETEDEYDPLKPAVSKSTSPLFVGYKLNNGIWYSDKGKRATQLSGDRFIGNTLKSGCAISVLGTHRWTAQGCNDRVARGAICRKMSGSTGVSTSKKVYYVIASGGNYYSLTPQCELDGGTVAKIESTEDQKAVMAVLSKLPQNHLSIFLRSIIVSSSRQVTWSDRKPLTYKPFGLVGPGTWCPAMTHKKSGTSQQWTIRTCSQPIGGVLCMKDPNASGSTGIHVNINININQKRSFIKIKGSLKSLPEWEKECNKIGGRLAHVDDQTVQRSVSEFARSPRDFLMIGIMRSTLDRRRFVYVGGKQVSFTYWAPGLPILNNQGSVCIAGPFARWALCSRSYGAVCEVFGSGTDVGGSSSSGASRPKIDISGVKKRYSIVTIVSSPTYENLVGKCAIAGGKVATLETLAETEKARQAIAARGASSALIGLKRVNGQLRWTTGSSSKFRRFGKGSEVASLQCVEMSGSTGLWTSASCNSRRLVCEHAEFGSGSSQLDAGGSYKVTYSCVKSWTSNTYAKWDTSCRSKNARLPIVLNAAENQALSKFVTDNQCTGNIFLGGQKVNNVLKWHDGSTISYTNFMSSSRPSNGQCLILVGGRWSFVTCASSRTNRAVCEQRTRIPGTQPQKPAEPSKPKGKPFFRLRDKRLLGYNDWVAKCAEDNGVLALIDNADDLTAIKTLMKGQYDPSLIAAKKLGGRFVNPGNQAMRHTLFAPGSTQQRHECIKMSTGWELGKMRYSSCFATSAVCQPAAPGALKKSKKKFILLKNKDKLNYETWKRQCAAYKAELAIIENVVEQDIATGMIKAGGETDAVLIQPKRMVGNKHNFVKQDNKAIPYTYWFSNEPNNLAEECTELMANADGKWNDYYCQHKRALCQVVDGGVANNAIRKKVFKLVVDLKRTMTRDLWETECRRIGGALATIMNAKEQEEVNKLLTTTTEYCYIAPKRNPNKVTEFINPDGKPIVYSNWNSGEPNYLFEKCTHVYSQGTARGKWNDIPCTTSHFRAAICELFETKVMPAPPVVARKKGFYVIQLGKQSEFNDLERACRKKGWTMATIDNAGEQNDVNAVVGEHLGVFLFALKRKAQGSRTFVNPGDKVATYTNWNSGEPNNVGNVENCAMVYGRGSVRGKWNDAYNVELKPMKKVFFVAQGSQYGYDKLKALCQQKGGSMAMIENSDDLKAAEQAIQTTSSSTIIDGKRSKTNPSQFVYSNGKPLSFTAWAPGEPNTLAEECVMIYTSGSRFGKWNDCFCHTLRTVLCQKFA